MLPHSIFESIQEIIEACAALCKWKADYLDHEWHESVRNLSKENPPLIFESLNNGRCETKGRRWERLGNLCLEGRYALEESQNSLLIVDLKLN